MLVAISRDSSPAETGFVMFLLKTDKIVVKIVVAVAAMVFVVPKVARMAARVKMTVPICVQSAETEFVAPNRPYNFLMVRM